MTGKDSASAAEAEIGKYLDILAKDPRSRVFAPLAEAYRKAGLLDDAVQTALEGLKLHPNYLGGRVALARAYFEKRQFADAAGEMSKVAQAAPDNLMAHKVLGQIAWQQGNLAAAEKSFRMVLLLDPRDAEAKQFLDSVVGVGAAAAPPAPEPPPAAGESLDASPAPAVEEIALEEISIDASARRGAAPDSPAAEPVDEFPAPTPFEPAGPGPGAETGAEVAAELADVLPEPAVEAPPEEPELEVFARERWGEAQGEEGPAEEPPSSASPHEEESPFEVFGRPKRGGPPPSTKGDTVAFREIELESTAHAATGDVEPEAPDGAIEVFTREPGFPATGARRGEARGAGRSEGATFREIELETTAYQVPAPEFGETPELTLEEEIPRIDLAEEFAGDGADVAPVPRSDEGEEPAAGAAEGESPAEAVPEVAPEPDPFAFPDAESPLPDPFAFPDAETPAPDRFAFPDAEIPVPDRFAFPDAETPVPDRFAFPDAEGQGSDGSAIPEEETPVVEAAGDLGEEFALAEEIPQVDLAAEIEDGFGPAAESGFSDLEDGAEVDGAEEDGAGPGAQRGIFNTETLAAIYTGQGFHARAAEIYRGLLAERPGDPDLARKLEEALARGAAAGVPDTAAAGGVAASGSAGTPPPGEDAPGAGGFAAEPPREPAAGGSRAGEATIQRLEALMNAFRSRKGRAR